MMVDLWSRGGGSRQAQQRVASHTVTIVTWFAILVPKQENVKWLSQSSENAVSSVLAEAADL